MLFSSLFILGSQEPDTVESPAVETGISLSPYARPGESSGKFTRLEVAQTGLDFETKVVPDHELSRLYHSGFVAGGIAIGDVNGDGNPDIFCAGSARPSRLYVQVGDMKFEDATDTAGMTDPSNPWSVGASLVDFDNDGDLDLYLCNYLSPNQLWLNDGAGHFEERGAQFGVDITDASLMAYFGDLDNDGWLDLYLLTNRIYNEEGWIKDFDMVRGPDNELQLE
ncbi:MAG: VCBS repeat-containing protein, partial [Planctomycetaceae bacterium]|nr:VCBS repeat-containing protein [Planctomycetaceae bacterium]